MYFPRFHFKKYFRVLFRPEWRYVLTLLIILGLMTLVFAAVFSAFEKDVSFWDGLWTAYITLTTIGYGDYSAHTAPGRVATVLTSLFGIGCFGVFTGVILEKAMQRRLRKMKGEGSYQGEGHLVVVNVPSYEEIRQLLKELDCNPDFADLPRVLVTQSLPDGDREIPEFLANRLDGFVMGLPSSMETLERANMSTARACLLLASAGVPGMDDTNTLTAALIERNWKNTITILSCSRSETMKNLDHFHIDGGVSATDLQMGLLVQELESQGVFQVFSQLSSNAGSSQIYISRRQVRAWNPDNLEIDVGGLKTALLALDLPLNIVGVKSEGEKDLDLTPSNKRILKPGDRLIYMADSRFEWTEWGPRILTYAQGASVA